MGRTARTSRVGVCPRLAGRARRRPCREPPKEIDIKRPAPHSSSQRDSRRGRHTLGVNTYTPCPRNKPLHLIPTNVRTMPSHPLPTRVPSPLVPLSLSQTRIRSDGSIAPGPGPQTKHSRMIARRAPYMCCACSAVGSAKKGFDRGGYLVQLAPVVTATMRAKFRTEINAVDALSIIDGMIVYKY
jgi:hypothetical protein